MRHVLLGAVAISALSIVLGYGQIAHAADKPVKTRLVKAPPPPAIYSWSGFYTGLNAGAAWGSYDPETSTIPDGVINGASLARVNAAGIQSINPVGFTGGSQAGYNWQWGNWVAGIEADFNYLHLNGAANTAAPFVSPSTNTAWISAYGNANWLATVRPRIGWAADNWLFYATGGPAVAGFKDDFALSGVRADGTAFYQQSSHIDNLPIGYAVGGGIETAITDRWSVKAEYLHVDFGRFAATQTANSNPTQVTSQSADLKADILRIGLNYRWGVADPALAYADAGLPMPVKAPQWTSPVWNKSDWEFDVGTRAWLSSGVTGGQQPLYDNPQILASRLTWGDLDGLSGESYGRVDHVSGWFVKGFLGAGGIFNGKLNDEDFPGGAAVNAYSNTYSSTLGSLGYGNIDLGYTFLKSSGAKLGAFVGYNYYTQHANANGCTQVAGGSECHGIVPNLLTISEDDHFNSLRVGLTAEYMLTDRLKFVGEAAYLPWMDFSGLDDHNARALVLTEQASGGDGAMLEGLLSYNITNSWNVGVGGRYWAWNTREGTIVFSTFTNGAGPPTTSLSRFTMERYGAFIQSGYHFDGTTPAAAAPASMPVKAPIVVAGPMDWTGFYVGGHLGGGWSDAHWSDPFGATLSRNGSVNVLGFGDATHGTGPLGGGQIGANWQTSQWVFGIAAAANAAHLRGDNTCFSGLGGINCEHAVNDISTVTGRVGYAWNRSLVYATAGGAWANTTYNLEGNTRSLALGTGSTSVIRSGWVAGVGLEYALTDHWTTSFEYDHIGLGSVTVPFPTVAVINTQSIGVAQSIDMLKLGLNYKFDWLGPIVARN